MIDDVFAKNARLQKKKRRLAENVNLFVFLLPTMFFILVFIAYPVIYSGYLSFTAFKFGIDKAPTFIFLQGYIDRITNDSLFTAALINQSVFAVSYFGITFFFSWKLAFERGFSVIERMIMFTNPLIGESIQAKVMPARDMGMIIGR